MPVWLLAIELSKSSSKWTQWKKRRQNSEWTKRQRRPPLPEKAPVHVKGASPLRRQLFRRQLQFRQGKLQSLVWQFPRRRSKFPVNGNAQGEEPSEFIVETAVDRMIQAMKRPRTSAGEGWMNKFFNKP